MVYLYNNKKTTAFRKKLRNNMPKPEQVLWYWLRGKKLKGYKFRRQYSVGSFILDFYCPELRLAIEIDGDSHFIDYRTKRYDQDREQYLSNQNIEVLRFMNIDVTENIEAVVDKIIEHLP